MTVVTVLVVLLFFMVYEGKMLTDEPLECPLKHFKVHGMDSCHPLLSCYDVMNITIIKRLGKGSVKEVFLVNWRDLPIVLSIPANINFLNDFFNGVEMLRALNPSKYVVQFVGYCDKMYGVFTEYHPEGNAADFFNAKLPKSMPVVQSIDFCLQYSLILNYLHNGPAGRRVFCDSNSLNKLLSQLLVTSDMKLILNDVDALPRVVDDSGIKCGHRQLEGKFVAPEQLWSRDDIFTDDLMPGYDEKTDIWKAAAVCDFFIKNADDSDVVKYRLFELHSKCRQKEPVLRPSSRDLVGEYSAVIEEFYIHSEL